jgi:F0F1-type ATP synthase membrane subunit b/b'
MLQIDATFLVIFAIVWALVFILSRVFFRPMAKTMDDRAAEIQADEEVARKSLAAREESLQTIDRTLKSARAAGERTKENIVTESLRNKSRLLEEVASASRADVERAKKELDAEIAHLKSTLASEAGRLAEKIEQRLLGR